LKVLVTGGAGYIGSATVAYLLKAGHKVVVYDSLENGHAEAVPTEAILITADMGDTTALNAVFEAFEPDAVIHFAAYIEAGISMQEPSMYFRNNTVNALSLLDAMVVHNVRRIVFSSTAGVYDSKDTHLTEDDAIGPANVYAESKLMVERFLHWYHQIHGLQYCALRYFNACGAMVDNAGSPIRGEAHNPESHLIPLVLQVALGQREAISVFGTDYPTPDGTCIRDYIHIEDLASAHGLALNALQDENNAALTVNLGNGRGYSIREVVETARQVTGHPIPSIDTDRRPGDAARLVADPTRAFEVLGWEPRFPALEMIIKSAWMWHQANPQGYTQPFE